MRVPRVDESTHGESTHGPRSRTPFSARGQEEGLLQRLQLLRQSVNYVDSAVDLAESKRDSPTMTPITTDKLEWTE